MTHWNKAISRIGGPASVAWQALAERAFPVPDMAGQDEGGFIFVWEVDGLHVEFEGMIDGSFEWFVSDRATATYSGDEGLGLAEAADAIAPYLGVSP